MRLALALAVVAACGAPAEVPPDPAALDLRAVVDSCDGFSRALDRIHGLSGRALAILVDDAVDAARAKCAGPADAARGGEAARQLARARLLDDQPAAALAALDADAGEPAIHVRRAELLDRLGRPADAIAALDGATARTFGARILDDDAVAASRRLLQVSIAARIGRHALVAQTITLAPIAERPRLAFRAAADAVDLDALAAAAGEPELAAAAADRIEQARGSVAALAAREHAVVLGGAIADHHDALARALAAAGRIDEALAAWDRAAATAPAQPSYRLAPIRALAAAGDRPRAHARVVALADAARSTGDADALLDASTAAAANADWALAVELARAARAQRPGDGRIAFALAERLADAGDRRGAADAFVELLVCGAHGRPWHRHEVAGKLVALAKLAPRETATAISASRTCTAVEPADLEPYLAGIREAH